MMRCGISASSTRAARCRPRRAAASAHRTRSTTCARCSTKCGCSRTSTNWPSCAVPQRLQPGRTGAPCALSAPASSNTRSRRNCCMNSATTARAIPPILPSSRAARMRACCITWATMPCSGRWRTAADRRRLRARRLRLGHYPHLPGQRPLQPPQRDVYELVLAAQEAAIAATRPGVHWNVPHDVAVAVLAQGIIDLKLCSPARVDGVLESRRLQPLLHAPHRSLAGHGRARCRRLQGRRRVARVAARHGVHRRTRLLHPPRRRCAAGTVEHRRAHRGRRDDHRARLRSADRSRTEDGGGNRGVDAGLTAFCYCVCRLHACQCPARSFTFV